KLHLQQHKASFDTSPMSLTADAGYGSEENYELMAAQEITAYVKYGLFDQQQSKKYDKKYPFAPSTLHYDQQGDRYICPMGQSMNFIGEVKRETSNGYQQTLRRYRAQNCGSCPLNGACHKSKGNVSAPQSTCFPVLQPIALHKNKSYGKRRNGPPDGGIRQERPDPERFLCHQRHECP